MMDSQLLSMLGKSLHSLEVDAPKLDDLLLPRSPSSGENAGKAPTRGKSKPPVVVPLLDVKLDVAAVLSRWVGVLTKSWPDECSDRPGGEIEQRAAWINQRIHLVDDSPWGEMCADEIIAQARLVSDVVMPPSAADDPMALEVGTAREIASWARNFGLQVSRSTVQRWANNGVITAEIAPDGRILVRLDEVLGQCRGMQWSIGQEQGRGA